jgi:hypothetical protein
MEQTVLARWDNFYVIVGSAAAALTGLQFVVMAFVGNTPARRASSATISAFGTPNVVHFAMVLLLSAVLSAPWPSLGAMAIALAVCGGGGLLYGVVVTRRAGRQTSYEPVLEDWLWHAALPLLAYAGVAAGALLLLRIEDDALFAIAAASLLLLFVGIHNAWDTVTYIATGQNETRPQGPQTGPPEQENRDAESRVKPLTRRAPRTNIEVSVLRVGAFGTWRSGRRLTGAPASR